MNRRKQDEFTRYRRLSRGCCPTHGISMTQIGVDQDNGEDIVHCPRNDCNFVYQVPSGSKTDYALRVACFASEERRAEEDKKWRERLARNGETL